MSRRSKLRVSLIVAVVLTSGAAAQETPRAPACKSIQGDLVEDRATTACRPGHTSCFVGTVIGNHGLRGTTYFKADGGAQAPASAPGWVSYSGRFEYVTEHGMLVMRETGVVNNTSNNPESGATSAFQKIVEASGDFAGSSGHFFVYGFNRNDHVVTRIAGEICTR